MKVQSHYLNRKILTSSFWNDSQISHLIVSTTIPTQNPTNNPSTIPSVHPTLNPSSNPTSNPSTNPTYQPTENPSNNPTNEPTQNPSHNPTNNPSFNPSNNPTQNPTNTPTLRPSRSPVSEEYDFGCKMSILDVPLDIIASIQSNPQPLESIIDNTLSDSFNSETGDFWSQITQINDQTIPQRRLLQNDMEVSTSISCTNLNLCRRVYNYISENNNTFISDIIISFNDLYNSTSTGIFISIDSSITDTDDNEYDASISNGNKSKNNGSLVYLYVFLPVAVIFIIVGVAYLV